MDDPAPPTPDDAAPTGLRVKDVVIGCGDVEAVAAFWSELLARPIAGRTGPYVWLQRREGVGLVFQAVRVDQVGGGSIHLDLGAHDPAAEQRRIESLGGRRVAGYEEGGFLVMADPEGNRFCVIPAGPFEVDGQGRTDYLARADGPPTTAA